MEQVIIFVLVILLFVLFLAWKFTRTRLKRLEYICMVNSQRLDFFYSSSYSEMRIKVRPRADEPWTGSVNEVYKAFASPTGWEARDKISTAIAAATEEKEIKEYKPGSWKK